MLTFRRRVPALISYGVTSQRLQAAVSNYLELLVASRNLDFFTSFYRYFIQLLPAAVVAPLFFEGKIEFGVVNQSQSAFGHILSDLSLVVYQVWVRCGCVEEGSP